MKKAMTLILAALLPLGGCSQTGSIYANFRAVEDLQLVQTFGFDWKDGEITVTVSSGEETDKLPSSLLSASAPDIPQAIEKLQDWSAREDLFFAHIRYVLVGEEAARHGLETLLDWFERGIQTRLDLPIFVVEGGTAKELISGSADKLYEITAVLLSLERDVERRGKSYPFTLRELASRMSRSGAGLCTSVRMAETGDNVPSAPDGVTALETGFAVFKDWKLAAFSGREAAEGICILLNKAGSGNVLLAGDKGFVTLEMGDVKSTFRPCADADGNLSLAAEIECSASVVSSDPGDLPHKDLLPLLEEEFGRWIQQRTDAALELWQKSGADFLELWRCVAAAPLPPEQLRVVTKCRGRVERSYDILFAENAPEDESHG